jgi:hypothetical protein
MSDRSEADRLVRESGLQRLLRRPEVGAFSVMLVIVVALAIASDFKAFIRSASRTTSPSSHSTASSPPAPPP